MNKAYSISDFLEIKSAVLPSFNFDGTKVVYLSNLTGTFQLYAIAMNGNNVVQLTSYEDGIGDFSISPTTDEILFAKCEKGNENYQLYLLDIATRDVKSLTNNLKVRYGLGGWSRDGRSISFHSNERNGTDFDIYTKDIESGNVRRVFDQGGNCASLGFSPSGKYLAVRKYVSQKSNYLFFINLETGHIEQIMNDGIERNIETVRVLPDESGFYFITDKDRDFSGLSFYDFVSKSERYVLTPDWDVTGLALSLDGESIVVTINVDGYFKKIVLNTKGMNPLQRQSFPDEGISSCSWSRDGRYLTFALGGTQRSSEIYVWDKESDLNWRIVEMPQCVPPDALVKPDLVRFASFDGLEIPAFLFAQKDESLMRRPAVIYIHGGPEAQFMPGFNPLIQFLVHKGFVVVAPNVRGSRGYGKEYLALDDVHLRMDSVKDIVALHEYLKGRDHVDIDKVFLWGGSYGGFMVLAGMCFYPELWAGGIDIVGISNFVTFLTNTASYRRVIREKEYGSLTDDREFLESISPINFVERIKAPLMIIHGANDPRVPLGEAKQIHEKITAMEGESELVVYSDEGHGLTKLRNRIDAYTKATKFLSSVIEK